MLAVQLLIVLVVLIGVAAVSVAQLSARYRETEGNRALAVAERLAVTAGVRDAASQWPDNNVQAQSVVESGRTFSGSTYVVVALPQPPHHRLDRPAATHWKAFAAGDRRVPRPVLGRA